MVYKSTLQGITFDFSVLNNCNGGLLKVGEFILPEITVIYACIPSDLRSRATGRRQVTDCTYITRLSNRYEEDRRHDFLWRLPFLPKVLGSELLEPACMATIIVASRLVTSAE